MVSVILYIIRKWVKNSSRCLIENSLFSWGIMVGKFQICIKIEKKLWFRGVCVLITSWRGWKLIIFFTFSPFMTHSWLKLFLILTFLSECDKTVTLCSRIDDILQTLSWTTLSIYTWAVQFCLKPEIICSVGTNI